MTNLPLEPILRLLHEEQPLSEAQPQYDYGTAGFRFQASIMDGLMVRVGLLGVLLLLQQDTTESSLDMGIMITASHNDESYNGVKLANPDGSMLTLPQEEFLTRWVNERNMEALQNMLEEQLLVLEDTRHIQQTRTLHLGRDTRAHSPHLAGLCRQGAECILNAFGLDRDTYYRVAIQDHGIVTTPMLHHVVLHSNPSCLPGYIAPRPSRQGYIDTFAQAYVDLVVAAAASRSHTGETKASPRLHVDGACGVGYRAVEEIALKIADKLERENATDTMTLFLAHNKPGDGPLNLDCGSEHVQKSLQPPIWYDGTSPANDGLNYCCALDGDADRIVFFGQAASVGDAVEPAQDELEKPKGVLSELLDGDKIAILIAHVLKQKMNEVGEAATLPSMGIVQTAYANGASTEYVEYTLQIPVLIAKTGVKHLHHAAVKHFDIGIYFEANGHGTVVFSKKYEEFALQQQTNGNSFFVKLHQLINPAVGDALCDMLLVDYLLHSALGGWTLHQWNTLYTDLPSRMLKVKVADRSIIKCSDNETKCLAPASVQLKLEEAMAKFQHGRTFIRPSGTEDVVRVYAEAATRGDADALANEAARIVYDTCQGVGERF